MAIAPLRRSLRERLPLPQLLGCVTLACLLLPGARLLSNDNRADVYSVGVARVDVTPDYPIRLNGFGFRRKESEGVSQRIWAKVIAIGAASDVDDGAASDEDDGDNPETGGGDQPAILITLDSLGIRMTMIDEVARRLKKAKGIVRHRIVLTFSHSHCAPKVNGASDNIFSQPIPADHQQHIDRYTQELTDKLEEVALAALKNRRPARIFWSVGNVGFAKNRRTPGGPVDHDLPVLVIRDLDGKVRAVYTSYACHCVTLSHNKISGDWAGYAQDLIERKFPGAIGLVSIGAGSDSNPLSGVTGDKVDVAASQGARIADEVARLLSKKMRPVHGRLNTRLALIDLPLNDPPSARQLRDTASRGGPAGYNALTQLARLDNGETLASAISYPIQTWTFGDSLAMVFLAGEVCVDYSLRLKKELDRERLWVNAYSNDFCSYIPSERLVREGGYGGGAEIPYFALPNTLKAGLEQTIVDEVKRQLAPFQAGPIQAGPIQAGRATQGVPPKTPDDSRRSIRTNDHLKVELVASEPLIDDPVAIDFGMDGRLWVAEMPDYTQATDAAFEQHGRIKFLLDTDNDGRFDKGQVFLDGLRFPTDVKVWRDGVLVCDAPDILWAVDSDGDGKADVTKKLFTGFATHNPHARVNSLRLGLDNWLYGSGGLFGGKITSFTGKTVDVSGRDFRLNPDTGAIEPVSGRSQQGRVRDDWGNWFGCDNSTILRHYPLADHYLRRNPHVAPPPSGVFVPRYPAPGQLYPTGDLVRFKLSGPPGRPTSVCGLGIYRDSLLGPQYSGNSFVCEPVNQLVHRLVLEEQGTTIRGTRPEDEQQREFLTSTDRWFRPVQVRTGPDGALWVVDMYRYVIEHPRWIPPETARQLDTFAGSGMGRIYRIAPRDATVPALPQLNRLGVSQLAARIDDSNGTVRDMVQQLLTWRGDAAAVPVLEKLVRDGKHAGGRLQALSTLDALGRVDVDSLLCALADEHAGVRRHAIRIAEPRLNDSKPVDQAMLRSAMIRLADDPSAMVRLQLAYSLGEVEGEEAAGVLARLLVRAGADPYLRAAAVSSLNDDNLAQVLRIVVPSLAQSPNNKLLAQLLATAANQNNRNAVPELLDSLLPKQGDPRKAWQLGAVARLLESDGVAGRLSPELRSRLERLMQWARQVAGQDSSKIAVRLDAIRLLAHDNGQNHQSLVSLLAPQQPLQIQQAAVDALAIRADLEASTALLDAWSGSSPAVRSSILDVLLRRKESAEQLLRAMERGSLPASQLSATRRVQLSERLKDTHARRVAKVLHSDRPGDRAAVLARFRVATQLKGDAAAGRLVFDKQCADCHRLNGQGHAVGPDLAALTNKSVGALLKATLDPSGDVDGRYLNYVAADKDGRIVTGILAEETGTSITIAEPAGKRRVILRRDLDQLRATGKSFMPDGLEKELSPQDLANLFAYVIASGPRPKTFPGNLPRVVVPAESGQLRLSAATAEIYGKTIRYEQPFGNIGYWHDEADHVSWRIRLSAAATYDVYLDWACADASAGNRFRIDGLEPTIQGRVSATGGWDKYQQIKLGSVTSPAGDQAIVVRTEGSMRATALFDLRSIYLVPRGQPLRVRIKGVRTH